MFKAFKEEWTRFKDSPPGERFISYNRRVKKASTASRVLRIGVGLLLFAAGVIMLVIPGPGILFMVFGLACFGGESTWVSKLLDKLELKARAGWQWCKRKWRAMPLVGKVTVAVIGVALAAGAAYVMYRVLWS